jgi:hypothetical protein
MAFPEKGLGSMARPGLMIKSVGRQKRTAWYYPIRCSVKKGCDMSLLDSILDKLGLKKDAKPAAAVSAPVDVQSQYMADAKKSAAPVPVDVADVVARLDGMAKKYPMKLNWKESIVDLLVLLDLPHKGEDLKALAVELKCPAEKIDDSFQRNMWLHKAVLQKIADAGGRIPPELLK